ncbi:MAG: nucleoside triphosphate pyrophosphohydrolase family protein [Erythrobacter sp.]|uniref:nucleoside triphosphate pyrophosphohydrolase family protein n=1 Tax=Parasphingorhabdus sp. TaxID=2709688 RepID=UPI00327FF6FE
MDEKLEQPTMLIEQYAREIAATDTMKPDIQPVLFGLFGEVGGIMAAAKKHHREGKVFDGYRHAVEEEFGDTLWYLAALCRRLDLSLETVLDQATAGERYMSVLAASDMRSGTVSRIAVSREVAALDDTLLTLGQAVSRLLELPNEPGILEQRLVHFADCYMKTLQVAELSFGDVARTNLAKTTGRFITPHHSNLPTFDGGFDPDEQLPMQFSIKIVQKRSGRSYLKWNGVFIGDPLTDNIRDADGYRFHDVFHFAHSAVLHWSPVMRALIKQKRKSDPLVDEAQDGGRAIVVEEGLTAWIFSRAKELNFFENQESLSFDMLKTIRDFVRGYEVDQCPLNLWEKAILDGYSVFRQVRANGGGIIVGDREARTIEYRPLEGN